ncbi:uncharacterized protein LOC106514017 [Austrofundulus limnaeus]|uniref:Uncharacterized protein LOC106514017 n=1 Tax=Austrofundulus limnaeus TaxID=52670 RepID=A0A2I4ASS7_AUSLI|nr:PREDICTED: uncharacterized protein LOC106514017 [Austrofundulus limnaeus]
MGSLRSGRSRPVCHRRVDSLPSVIFPYGGIRRTGPGRLGTSLAKSPSICLSTPFSDLANPSESSRKGPQSAADSSILASTTMVPTSTESVSRRPMVSSNQEGPIVSVGGTDLAPQSSTPQAVGVATGRLEQQLTGYSDSVRYTILSARAHSTHQQYENRWRLFSQWCADRDEDPVSCVVPTILEFLQSLLNKGRSPSTLKEATDYLHVCVRLVWIVCDATRYEAAGVFLSSLRGHYRSSLAAVGSVNHSEVYERDAIRALIL